MSQRSIETTSPIPPPPRSIDPRVRRRTWNEPGVRFCWLMGAVLTVVAALFAVDGLQMWRWETALVRDGIPVDATIHTIAGISRAGASFDPSNPVQLQFPWQGQAYLTRGQRVLEDYGRFVTVGDPVNVRVDPNDPENWTFLTEAMPLGHRLLPAMLILPAAALTLLAGVWRRSRIVLLLCRGEATAALVLGTSISALAPCGGAVRCTPSREGDRRVFTVYASKPLERGENIQLLALDRRAVAAERFL